jgi:formylglycine-generating enzyme
MRDCSMSRSYKPTNELGPTHFPPTCANAWGDDDYGLFLEIKVSAQTQRFRWIEPGDFQMGSPNSEAGYDGEVLQQWVRISQGYWMADSACSQAFWLAVIGGKNPSRFYEDAQNPVERITQKEAIVFMKKLNELLIDPNLQATLPSAAEWEYACRAGTKEAFSFGTTITPEQVNYDGNYPYNDAPKGLYRKRTVPVKSLPPNAWGLYEMHGNVWEWCRDTNRVYDDKNAQAAIVDPEEAGEKWLLRGGSWFNGATNARSAFFAPMLLVEYDGNIGFRVILRVHCSKLTPVE